MSSAIRTRPRTAAPSIPLAPVPRRTVADLLAQLGDIPPERVQLQPSPGQATEQDLLALHEQTNRLYELVEGTLVEKPMGYPESYLACQFIRLLGNFAEDEDLGFVVGPDAITRLMPGLIRLPDVSFITWSKVPGHEIPDTPIA